MLICGEPSSGLGSGLPKITYQAKTTKCGGDALSIYAETLGGIFGVSAVFSRSLPI